MIIMGRGFRGSSNDRERAHYLFITISAADIHQSQGTTKREPRKPGLLSCISLQ